MSYEMLVGLQIKDESLYAKYREGMTPLLEKSGGGFRYDFKVSDVLKNEGEQPINRVFAIFFESKEKRDLFFSNEDYLKIRNQFYDKAVAARSILSEYQRDHS